MFPLPSNEPKWPFKCLSCGVTTMVYAREARQMAGFPLCSACGQSTEPPPEVMARLCPPPLKKDVEGSIKPLECPVCSKAFRTEVGLHLHVEDNHPVLKWNPARDRFVRKNDVQ